MVLRQAVDRFGVPVTILSDNGSCFVGSGYCKKPQGSWMPTLFEIELPVGVGIMFRIKSTQSHAHNGPCLSETIIRPLPALNIALINSRPYHPQTNGKLERFHRSVEDEIWRYASLADYIEYYNTDRLHWALDINNYETPMRAFYNKVVTDYIKRQDPEWVNADINKDHYKVRS